MALGSARRTSSCGRWWSRYTSHHYLVFLVPNRVLVCFQLLPGFEVWSSIFDSSPAQKGSELLSPVAWLRGLIPPSLTVCSTALAGPPWRRTLATAPHSSAVPGKLLFSLSWDRCESASLKLNNFAVVVLQVLAYGVAAVHPGACLW